jgi:uncharacterized protein YndB with AHSA1/START domain
MRVDEASRTVAARPDDVYRALTDPRALEQWLPPAGMTGRIDVFQPVPGGAYRMTLTYDAGHGGKTTAAEDVVTGRFVELVPGQRVVQEADFASSDPELAGTMRMEWLLAPQPDGTAVTVRATDVPPGISPEDHATGMASSLANLDRFLVGAAG